LSVNRRSPKTSWSSTNSSVFTLKLAFWSTGRQVATPPLSRTPALSTVAPSTVIRTARARHIRGSGSGGVPRRNTTPAAARARRRRGRAAPRGPPRSRTAWPTGRDGPERSSSWWRASASGPRPSMRPRGPGPERPPGGAPREAARIGGSQRCARAQVLWSATAGSTGRSSIISMVFSAMVGALPGRGREGARRGHEFGSGAPRRTSRTRGVAAPVALPREDRREQTAQELVGGRVLTVVAVVALGGGDEGVGGQVVGSSSVSGRTSFTQNPSRCGSHQSSPDRCRGSRARDVLRRVRADAARLRRAVDEVPCRPTDETYLAEDVVVVE